MKPKFADAIIRKQYYNRMTIAQLAELHEVDAATIERIVEGVTQKDRTEHGGIAPLSDTLTEERLLAYIAEFATAARIAYLEGATVEEVLEVAEEFGHLEALEAGSVEKRKEMRNQRIGELVAAGKTSIEISELLNVKRTTVYDICRKYGFKSKRAPRLHKDGRQARANEIAALAKEGYNARQIANKLGIHVETVRNAKRDYGIPMNKYAKKEETTQ